MRRNNERLQRQLTALQAGRNASSYDMDVEDADDGGGDEKEREERIKTLSDNLKAVAAVFSAESAEYKAKKAELDSLLRAKRECKPLNVQIQRVDKRIEGQKRRTGKAEEAVGFERKRLREVQGDLEGAEKELDEARKILAELEEERKQLLLRETQALAAPSPPTADTHVDAETEAWERTMGSIDIRVRAPGVQPELAAQIASTLTMLRSLCSQLPAKVPTATTGVADAAGADPSSTSTSASSTSSTSQGSAASPQAMGTAPPPIAMAPVAPTLAAAADASAVGAAAVGPTAEAAAEVSDAEVGDDAEVDEEAETLLSGLSQAQRARIRELLGRRARGKGRQGRLKKPIDDNDRDRDPKKPSKGGE
jgi:myosin heavy subunit